jgi:methionyl-tRNA formyltransferase
MKKILNSSVNLVKLVNSPKIKILFLGYSQNQTELIEKLIQAECEVWHTKDQIQTTSGYDLVISFGFQHILKKDLINNSAAPIINLHISYLPWNRGAHPNFWSFFDSTPIGVTIHLIDEGIDTGPIIYQRHVNFDKDENTFSKTYKRLIKELENLFIDNIDEIISKNFAAIPQKLKGTLHNMGDLPKDFAGWDSEITKEIIRLHITSKKKLTE